MLHNILKRKISARTKNWLATWPVRMAMRTGSTRRERRHTQQDATRIKRHYSYRGFFLNTAFQSGARIHAVYIRIQENICNTQGIRQSLASGQLPFDWKIGRIVPTHKSGSCDNVFNYRPISLTGKLLEHVILPI